MSRTSDVPATPADLKRRQRGKNIAVLIVLIGVALLFYAISVVKFRVS